MPPSGIADERACYVEHTGIAQNIRVKKYQQHRHFLQGWKQRSDQRRVLEGSGVGMAAFAAGPNVHLVDPFALTDPLLARIRFAPKADWRPGHMNRPLPAGYLESVESGQNLVEEPCAHALLDDIWLITRGTAVHDRPLEGHPPPQLHRPHLRSGLTRTAGFTGR